MTAPGVGVRTSEFMRLLDPDATVGDRPGIVDRAGEAALHHLFAAGGLPTPAEIDAPGLWLARLELDT